VDGDGTLRDWEDEVEVELDEAEALRSRARAVLVYMRGARDCIGCICFALSGSEVSQVGSRGPSEGEIEGGELGAPALWL